MQGTTSRQNGGASSINDNSYLDKLSTVYGIWFTVDGTM